MVGHLTAVWTVAFVAVVFGRVVAGRDHDTGLAAVLPHRVGEDRSRFQLGEQMDGDAVRGKHPRRFPGKKIGFDARVEGDGDRRRLIPAIQIIRQALSRLADGVNIHAVLPGPDDTSQAARAELQLPVEAVLDRVLLPFDVPKLPDEVGILHSVLQPELIFLTNFSVHG